MNLTVYIESLGCAKNLIDAEIMLGILNKYGYKLTNTKENADVIIVNTCGFIEAAKEESINTIIELGLLKQNRLKLLIVSGCLGERYHQELINELPEVDAVVGTGSYDRIIEIIHDSLKGSRIVAVGNIDKLFDESLPRYQATPSHTAYIKIADGCNNFCTYCIIPKLRGKYRSRKIENIVKEAAELAANGVKEIILIAQDTTRYGIDIYEEYALPRLLRELCKVENIQWVRLLYAYTEMVSEELIEVMASEEKIVKYIDMPIQHCSSEILKIMNRRTSKDSIIRTIEGLRASMPDITIRTSLIVGFPGEEEGHYQELEDFVKAIRFDRLGVFAYSKEEDTPAARLTQQVDEAVKEARRAKIMALQQGISYQKNQEKVGKCIDVLIEEELDSSREFIGRGQGDAPEIDGLVYVKATSQLEIGSIVRVKINGALEYDLMGEIADESCE